MIRMLALLLTLLPALAPTAARAQAAPVVVGAVVSQTGQLSDLASGYRKGLLLWRDEVNEAGGLLGRRVELRLLDDQSEAITSEKLYARLLSEHGADLLIGPFGSAASRGAAAAAERAHRILINATGGAGSVLRAGHRYVFQLPAPYSAYGANVLGLVRHVGYRRLFILGRDDPASRDMAEHAVADAAQDGLSADGAHVYSPGMTDFAPLVAMARKAGDEAWVAFGTALDAAEMVKTFKRLNYAPKLFFAQGASEPRFIAAVGQDAEKVIGLSAYEPSFVTPGNAIFVKAYTAKWSSAPGLAAAEGYAAGQLLQKAVERAGTLDQEKLRETLATLETETVLGRYKLDPGSGEQLGARPALLQILEGRREVVWPDALAVAMWQLPYPRWQDRKILH